MAFHILANQEYHVWARRTGKSYGLTGPRSLMNAFSMPRSNGAFIVPTYKMGLTQTIPNTIQAWQVFGLKEGLHYVINRKPPEKWGWAKPFVEPRNWENTISFFNGSIIVIISQDRVGTSNSRSLDWIIVDEAKFIDYDRLKTETIPALSGSIDTIRNYNNHPRFKSALYCTDMPVLKKSQWILDFEDQMDTNQIELIKKLRKKQAKSKSSQIRSDLQRMLDKLRGEALYYSEADIFDNIKIVGEKYVRDQKRNLPAFEFQTALLNMKPGKVKDGFYPNISKHHYYKAGNNAYLQNLNYNSDNTKHTDCRMDADLDKHKPLEIACDYNANINWMAVAQADEIKMQTVNSLYVKTPRRLRELCQDFSEYYKHHPNKDVNFYYDSTAIKSNYATGESDFKDIVIEELSNAGWNVNPVYIGKPMKHNLKHLYIDRALKGEEYKFPLFNEDNNEQLLFAMEQTKIRIGRNGFEKDKSEEKKEDTKENPLELRTDATDAWDTLFIGINFYRTTVAHGTPGAII